MLFPFARHVSERDHGHPDRCRFSKLNSKPNALRSRIDYYLLNAFIRPESEQNSSHLQIDCGGGRWQSSREVHVERYNHRHRLWKVEAEFAPDMDTHDVSISRFGSARGHEELFGHRPSLLFLQACRGPTDVRGRHRTANVPRDFAAHCGATAAASTSASVRRSMLCVEEQPTEGVRPNARENGQIA